MSVGYETYVTSINDVIYPEDTETYTLRIV